MYKIIAILGLTVVSASVAFAADAPFVVSFEGIEFSIVEQAPHLNPTPLQVFGVFEYKSGDIFGGADVEMDEGLHGLIQDIRKNHQFEGRLGENLLLKPTESTVVPKQVLVMGMGDPSKFKATDMAQVGATEVREACRMGLSDFAHASDVQDAGVHRFQAGEITENVLTGMIESIRLQRYLTENKMADACPIKKIALLAGPKFFKKTTEALSRVIQKTGRPGETPDMQ